MNCQCGRPAAYRSGLCTTCYQRARRAGNVVPRHKRRTWEHTVNRFWEQVEKLGPGDCWPWLGGSTDCTNGRAPDHRYGRMSTWRDGKWQATYAHRIAYEIAFGPIPAGMTVDHICFDPLCCNPAHLQLLTRSENSARKSPSWLLKVQAAGAKRVMTHCKHGHPFTPENTYRYKRRRMCRECMRQRASRAKRLAA